MDALRLALPEKAPKFEVTWSEPMPLPRTPVNRDMLVKCFRRIGLTHYDEGLIKPIERAEWFDFGSIRDVDMRQAGLDSLPFMEARLDKPPFPYTVFRFRLISTDPGYADREYVLLIEPAEVKPPETKVPWSLRMWTILGVDGELVGFVDDFLTMDMYYLALWMILNCKGLPRTVREPSAKLNKTRAKRGQAALQRVTQISAATYITALRETERMEGECLEGSGIGSPKRTHLRRGHLRTLPRSGKRIFIRPMIINPAGPVPCRERYEFKE